VQEKKMEIKNGVTLKEEQKVTRGDKKQSRSRIKKRKEKGKRDSVVSKLIKLT
jgi:hypothetical protein